MQKEKPLCIEILYVEVMSGGKIFIDDTSTWLLREPETDPEDVIRNLLALLASVLL